MSDLLHTEINHDLSAKWTMLENEISKVVFGHEKIISKICIGLLSNGHILLEGVPGIAKTTLVKTLAKCLGLKFNRIQFTPDLLPSDIVGTVVYNPKEHDFYTKKGPIFASVILADEINRAPAKVQSALLEAMEEYQVTIGSETFALEKPMIVLATQNPADQEGTYPLPEAQTDRFMFKILLTYPDKASEFKMISSKFGEVTTISQILNKDDILQSQAAVKQVFVNEKIINYALDIVATTRGVLHGNKFSKIIRMGASPRATIFLCTAAKAYAFLAGRSFVTPDDIKFVATDVLRHRIALSYEAEIDGLTNDGVVKSILDIVATP